MYIYRFLDHPNVLSYYGISYESYDDCNEAYFILLPLASSDLTAYMKNNSLHLNQKIWICLSIARGMEFIHSYQIVHRDLKPDNIFIFDGDNEEEPLICIADMGIAVTTSDSTLRQTCACGTFGYMSPEMIEQKENLTTPILMKSDVFSFAFVVYELLSGTRPFDGDNIGGIAMKMLAAKHKNVPPLEVPSCNDELSEIIYSCWNWLPNDRPDFKIIVNKLEVLYSSLKSKQ